jgi:hypothetical protein
MKKSRLSLSATGDQAERNDHYDRFYEQDIAMEEHAVSHLLLMEHSVLL